MKKDRCQRASAEKETAATESRAAVGRTENPRIKKYAENVEEGTRKDKKRKTQKGEGKEKRRRKQ